jgi:peroxiredoxin
MELDLTGPFGLGGLRTKRFSAYVVDSEIKVINVEPDNTGLTCTLAPSLLSQICDMRLYVETMPREAMF